MGLLNLIILCMWAFQMGEFLWIQSFVFMKQPLYSQIQVFVKLCWEITWWSDTDPFPKLVPTYCAYEAISWYLGNWSEVGLCQCCDHLIRDMTWWCFVTHICVCELDHRWSVDGLLSGRNQSVAWIHDLFEGILAKGPYLPCVSMAGRALLAGYHRIFKWIFKRKL